MPTPITRFKCDYCKRHYSIKSDAVRHEKQCFWNPANKSCVTCSNLTIDGNCLFTQQPAFSKGHSVHDCKDWIEGSFEDEEYE